MTVAPPVHQASAGGLRGWLARFRRITTSGNFVPEIDGLRFIAISGVVLDHIALYVTDLSRHPMGLFELGGRGVEPFFVISGFILAVPFASQYLCGGPRIGLRKYFLRRVTRLEPPYLLALLIFFTMKVLWRHQDPAELFPYLLASCAYVHNACFGFNSAVLRVAWSLEVEVQFYILMPLLALIFLVRRGWLRRGILFAAIVAAVWSQPIIFRPLLSGAKWSTRINDQLVVQHVMGEDAWQKHILNYIQFFLAGMLLADIYVVQWKQKPAAARWGDVVWLLGWPALIWLLTTDNFASRLAFPLMVLLLYVALFRSTIARRLMSLPLITAIGGMCYSIYLLHIGGIELSGAAIKPLLIDKPFALQLTIAMLIMIPVILLTCGTFFRLIERPCMKRDWPKRLWGWFTARLFVEESPRVNSR